MVVSTKIPKIAGASTHITIGYWMMVFPRNLLPVLMHFWHFCTSTE
jgi:hypothetical protein